VIFAKSENKSMEFCKNECSRYPMYLDF